MCKRSARTHLGQQLFPTQPLVASRCSVARITSSKDLIRPWELWSMMSLCPLSISVLAGSWKALHEMTNRWQMQSKTFQVHQAVRLGAVKHEGPEPREVPADGSPQLSFHPHWFPAPMGAFYTTLAHLTPWLWKWGAGREMEQELKLTLTPL